MEGLASAAGHEDRHEPLKSYCKALLLPGERKSIEPMAARLDPDPKHTQRTRQSLHHLVVKAEPFFPYARAGHLGFEIPRPAPDFRPRGSPRTP